MISEVTKAKIVQKMIISTIHGMRSYFVISEMHDQLRI